MERDGSSSGTLLHVRDAYMRLMHGANGSRTKDPNPATSQIERLLVKGEHHEGSNTSKELYLERAEPWTICPRTSNFVDKTHFAPVGMDELPIPTHQHRWPFGKIDGFPW